MSYIDRMWTGTAANWTRLMRGQAQTMPERPMAELAFSDPLRIGGRVRVELYFGEMNRKLTLAQIKPLMKCGSLVRKEAQDSMHRGQLIRTYRAKVKKRVEKKLVVQTDKRGRIKTRKRMVTVPSAPGTPPNISSGALKRSLKVRRFGTKVFVVAQAYYGKFHEYGSARTPKRPFLVPALERARSKFAQQFKDALEAVS